MLGKTIYNLATNSDPTYIRQGNLPAPLFHVIDRCCNQNKQERYQNLADLRQSIVIAFDVVLERRGGISNANQLLDIIVSKFQFEGKFKPSMVANFVEQLGLLDWQEKIKLCERIPKDMFFIFSHSLIQPYAKNFLKCYEELVESQSYNFVYAETIASNMNIVFYGPNADPTLKGFALDLAIRAAIYMNRFAAMDQCIKMICNVNEEPLGSIVAALINKHRKSFIKSIEPFNCRNQSIICAIKAINT
jgi:hypothetical protein